MKKILLIVSVFSFLSVNAEITATVLEGQRAEEKAKNSELVRMKNFTNVPNYVRFKKGKELPLVKVEGWLKTYYQTEANYGLMLIDEELGSLGLTHYRYKQTVNGYPVENSMFLVHTNNGVVSSMNGELFSNIVPNHSVGMTEATALTYALGHVGATTYKWQIEEEEKHLKWRENNSSATYFPKGELVLVSEGGKIEGEMKLAYKFNIYAAEPFGRSEVFVDAKSGKILWEKNLIHEADVTGTASTLYSGNQTITCDNTSGNNHRLQETGRGNGIRTFTNNNTTNYTNTDITNNSNNWGTPDAGLDAHWGAEMTYDYYLNEHGRNSIDGAGYRLDSYVHHDNNYSNAFWDGNVMTYGDGSGNNAPFTAIDIAGHEVTHGLVTNTANLVYQAESGALNESFADIFGISIDIINRNPNAFDKWKLGDDLGFVIRDMIDPNAEGDPDTYFGTNWASLTGGDNGGVHTNSGVQNYWFVLLAETNTSIPGIGTGTNDNNDFYTVVPIGIQDAGRVAFRNLTVYLTQNSGYNDARFYGIQSAVDLFGPCSHEVEQVTNAWYAVGVGPEYVAGVVSDFIAPSLTSCTVPFTVNFNNTSVNGTTYSWDFGDGNTSTQNNPTNNYMANGTYTVELIADGGLCGIDTVVKTAYITVSTPPTPVTTDDNICENNTANLLASGTGLLNWYTAATGGTPFTTGTNYVTPSLATTTTYYVENVIAGATGNMGKADNTGGGANYNNFQNLFFDVYAPMELISVNIYPQGAGNRTIELKDDNGTVLNSTTVNLPASGMVTVNLNYQIQPGTDYELGMANNTANIDMYRNNAGTAYPYTLAGVGSVTRSSAGTNPTGYYYFFYDWVVKEQDCVSPRQPVTANVSVCTDITELANETGLKAFYNANNNIELALANINKGNYTISVLNALGQVVVTTQLNVNSDNQTEILNLPNKAQGMYLVNLYNDKDTYTVKLMK